MHHPSLIPLLLPTSWVDRRREFPIEKVQEVFHRLFHWKNAQIGQCIQEFLQPSKICERQPLKNLKWYGLPKQSISFQFFKGCLPQILLGPFLETLIQIITVKSWPSQGWFSTSNVKVKNRDVYASINYIQSFLIVVVS